jgi:enhancing lycopene biosynthesis protein 2
MKVAVILSGSGFMDGSEIQESVLCLLKLSQENIDYQCFAPNILQKATLNHLTQDETKEKRNVLIESARISRGNVKNLETLTSNKFDALLLPGGFGVATTLSNFSTKGSECKVIPKLQEIIKTFYLEKKPIGATCISPAVVAKSLEGIANLKITLGTGKESNEALQKMGMTPILTNATEFISDDSNLVYTTPAYMEEATLSEIFQGITGVILKLKENSKVSIL